MRSGKFAGRTALVTGGGSGLATAKFLSEQGAKVVLVGLDPAKLGNALDQLGPDALSIPVDVSRIEEIEWLVSELWVRSLTLDVLFADTAISECPPVLDTDEAFFDRLFDVNVKGVFFLFARLFPLLNRGASVVLTSSAAHDGGRPDDPLFEASVAALQGLRRALAMSPEVLEKGIRVDVTSPWPARDPLAVQASSEMPETIGCGKTGNVPCTRWETAERRNLGGGKGLC